MISPAWTYGSWSSVSNHRPASRGATRGRVRCRGGPAGTSAADMRPALEPFVVNVHIQFGPSHGHHGASKPRLVRLQLRGVERLPREGPLVPGPEAEGPPAARRG